MSDIQIITYDPRHRAAFKSLNVEWIEKYFRVEEKDLEQLDNPEECLEEGGEIFFALLNGRPVGTCALYKMEEGVYELAKMGVDPNVRGQGLGDRLMEAAENWARARGAREIMLQSNTSLEPAIHLYRKHGYQQRPIAATEYARCNIEMAKTLI